MEMGSGSLTDSGGSSTNSSTESLNCLKFGQKIYFENTSSSSSIAPATIVSATTTTTMGSPPPPPLAKPCPGSSSSSGSGKKPKTVQSGQSPRCQVEGCEVDLSDAKTYYSRHKVCGMHSKAARVIVAGLQQRFCQQCSRFHQLPEFDQGKRSCRRRLAGHNERRRKPPPGSLLSSSLSRLSSSFIENNGRGGGFMMDFTAYPRLSRREAWPTGRSSEHESENQNAATGWSLPHQWQNSSENPPPPNLFLHGLPDGTGFPSTGIPPGECFTGVVDSNCALSLLSNQPWDSTNRASALGVNDMMNTELSHSMSQPAMPHGPVMNPYSNASWGFKDNDSGCSSQEMPPHLGLGQFSEPINSHFSDGLQLSQQTRRQYMELEPSSTDNTSMLHIHRSL